tara:strand:- start:1097 stop:1405 length:309 start_codon:yes stop_codon:yes gene_type:complete
MSESNNLPQAISHKKLSFLLLNALKEKSINGQDIDKFNDEREDLKDEINKWQSSTKDLLKKISNRDENLFKEKSSESIMALGAMEVHLNMALHALNVFKKDK